ncbi:hypothetical protein [Pseudomonas abietaniphila]|uniref:Uncharacterized protein n=1 Tax=Pseudomonas abietaniphila TaxID=89065 RepID=A0A1G8RP48_9PSED|nr:hypothetical protein [Pseudomonas abietaniphila]SDJ18844.1 hypothetical protein SAMN05216605_12312 [Pseudomonas abietaniphila]
MPRYHICFSASRDHFPQATEHTRVLFLEHPIEYDSDIIRVQDWAAKQVEAGSTMLTSWRELKGSYRPGAYHCPTCRLELPEDRVCDVCGGRCNTGELPAANVEVADGGQ